jgi:SAM-dependent methyltransferase
VARRLDRVRRTRRRPSPLQHDYLHLRRLLDDLVEVLGALNLDGAEVLDLFCGARPYEDLLGRAAGVTGLDVADDYGVADVVTGDFLPFEDGRFDLVLCTQAFYFLPDAAAAAAEIRRVLRPGGSVVITVPHVQEYDRRAIEHRFTGPQLAALFSGWEDVRVMESGNRAVAWTTVTGRMLLDLERAISSTPIGRRAIAVGAPLAHLALNGLGLALERLDRRLAKPGHALPCNLLLWARAPLGAPSAPAAPGR